MVTETPHWQFGGRANVELGAFEFGIQGKHVGSRFATDVNDVKAKGYAIFDLDALRPRQRAVMRADEHVPRNIEREPVLRLVVRDLEHDIHARGQGGLQMSQPEANRIEVRAVLIFERQFEMLAIRADGAEASDLDIPRDENRVGISITSWFQVRKMFQHFEIDLRQ